MRFLVCGVGSVGERHISNLLALGYEDIILYRRRNLPLRTITRSFSTFGSLDDALLQEPDVAVVSNPTSLHIPTAMKCAKAGCNLFIEKPLSNNLDGIDELRGIVSEKKLTVFVGFQFRFHPGLRKIKELLEGQAIGRVVCVAAHWGEYLPDWHSLEDYRSSYSSMGDMGGGVVLTLCHPFDYLRWLMGEILSVTALGGQLSDLQLAVEDTVDVLLEFVSGSIGHVHLDYIEKPPSHWFQITGCDGQIKWDNIGGKVRLYRQNRATWEEFLPPEKFERNVMFIDEMRHFAECVQGAKRPLISIEEGLKNLKVLMATKQSMLERKTIPIMC